MLVFLQMSLWPVSAEEAGPDLDLEMGVDENSGSREWNSGSRLIRLYL